MATAPKAKAAEEAQAAATPKKSKKKLIIFLMIFLLLAGAGGGAAFFFISKKNAEEVSEDEEVVSEDADKPKASASAKAKKKGKPKEVKPPVFMVIEPFTVNLQPDNAGEQFLQVAFSLQVEDQIAVDAIKLYMPQVRSRLLLLLSGKKASQIASTEGKKKLAEEIIEQIKQPFAPGLPEAGVTNVFFTSFVIQ